MTPGFAIPPGPGLSHLGGCPLGFEGRVLAATARQGATVLHVALDENRALGAAESLSFFAPDIETIVFPAWDCMPYDRVSPAAEVMSRRIAALERLAAGRPGNGCGLIVVTTVNAILQRVLGRADLASHGFEITAGQTLPTETLVARLIENGYQRVDTVHDRGDFAQRGGIIDLFPPESDNPVRIDFFGDDIEGIRLFDPASQRTVGTVAVIRLGPTSEVMLNSAAVALFRAGYRELAGSEAVRDRLYEAVSAGRRHAGMEHFLPLFAPHLETLFDYLPEAVISFESDAVPAMRSRFETIADYFETRQRFAAERRTDAESRYVPLPPKALYLAPDEWQRHLAERRQIHLSPFLSPDGAAGIETADAGARPGIDFAETRNRPGGNLYDDVAAALAAERRAGRRIVVAAYSEGSAGRLAHLLGEHGLERVEPAQTWPDIEGLPQRAVAVTVLGLERGFRFDTALFVTEQDILGDRLVRRSRRRRTADQFIAEASALSEGDLVVHMDHGIGRYEGLETLDVGGAPHDCLRIVYDGNDKLFVPVENIEVLSRFGSDEGAARLDKLGSAAWQARAARVKKRLLDMADALIRIAAARALKPAPVLSAPEGAYAEFAARFPYHETEDQLRAIEDCLADLTAGKPMDRLICGDVGFGKTEVALRATFAAVMAGYQVAIIAPTTLLSRQHFETFKTRFDGLPVRIGQLSRLVSSNDAAETRDAIASGKVDIAIGTHALLGKRVVFRNLGLVVIDEEQHFGVSQKEKLKELRAEAHVLTLTATPIPRTLQLALTGVREMSIIATPPVDRLAVRTFILPFDPVIVREAILREFHRGGQVFYVCPRIQDIPKLLERLNELVPEVKTVAAHGGLAPQALDDVMTAFYDGAYDVLVSTQIIESGLDVPNANTMIVHRADMFGLAQLYQLRGRIGRSKTRAYAYLTLPVGRVLTKAAQKRLEVFHTLDSLGAGFTLASHDLDIRGAGNLLGDAQSGHIREVGIELYQNMLEEAVSSLKSGDGANPAADHGWTPQISIGTPVLIPDSYVSDLNVRLGLYRRLATLVDRREIDAFAAELIDRFGRLPDAVENLLEIMAIKQSCREAGVEKVEGGPRGAVIAFRDDRFANPAGLIGLMQKSKGTMRLRPDHRLVVQADWSQPDERTKGVGRLLADLAAIARAPAEMAH